MGWMDFGIFYFNSPCHMAKALALTLNLYRPERRDSDNDSDFSTLLHLFCFYPLWCLSARGAGLWSRLLTFWWIGDPKSTRHAREDSSCTLDLAISIFHHILLKIFRFDVVLDKFRSVLIFPSCHDIRNFWSYEIKKSEIFICFTSWVGEPDYQIVMGGTLRDDLQNITTFLTRPT